MLVDASVLTAEDQQPTGLSEFWTWVKRTFTDPYRDEINTYLAQSIDHADVERRIKVLMKRGML